MSVGKIIAYIFAAISIFFGVLFIWATFSPTGNIGWLIIGIISVGIGFGTIWFTGRLKNTSAEGAGNVTFTLDLPGDVHLDQLECNSCGGAIKMENINMIDGAPVVNCPYCGSTYQITEEPKW